MIRNILTNIFLTIFSISILFIIYGCFVIPYKIITNTARSDSSQIYASFNDKLGYVPNNNLNTIINLNYIGRSYKVFTDSNGARIAEKNINDEKKTNEILLIGDSFSFGYGVNYEDTFAYILQLNLDVNINNLSVSGYGTVQSLKMLKKNLKNEKIIIYGFIEDHLRRNVVKCGFIDGIYCIHVPYASLSKEGNIKIVEKVETNNFDINQTYNQRLVERDYFHIKDLYYGIKYMKDSFYKRAGFYKDRYEINEKIIILKSLLQEMLDIANEKGAKLIFVNLDLHSSKEVYNNISKSELKEDIYFLDAAPKVINKNDLSKLFIKHDGHPNANGHNYFADELTRFLKKENLL